MTLGKISHNSNGSGVVWRHDSRGRVSHAEGEHLGRSVHPSGVVRPACSGARKPTGFTSACLVWSGREQGLCFPKFRPVSMMVSWSSAEGKVQRPVCGSPPLPGALNFSNAGPVAGGHRYPGHWS